MTTKLATILTRLCKCERGSPATEFALIAPMLLLMSVGVIDFGMTVRAKSEVEASARAGLQKGFGDMWDTTDIETAAKDALSKDPAIQASAAVTSTASCYCNGTLTASGAGCTETMTVATVCGAGGGPLTHTLTVDVSRQHKLMFNYYVLPTELTLTGSATARTQP